MLNGGASVSLGQSPPRVIMTFPFLRPRNLPSMREVIAWAVSSSHQACRIDQERASSEWQCICCGALPLNVDRLAARNMSGRGQGYSVVKVSEGSHTSLTSSYKIVSQSRAVASCGYTKETSVV